MKKILYVNACVRAGSRTNELARFLIDRMDGELTEIRLAEEVLVPLDEAALEKRDKLLKTGLLTDESFSYARQFAEADAIVISAPYWDLLFPAALRIYLETVSVCGITFRYSHEGRPVGLCKAKQLVYVTTAGGYIGNNNFGFDYIKALSRSLYGITQVSCFTAEGLDIVGADTAEIMKAAKEKAALFCG